MSVAETEALQTPTMRLDGLTAVVTGAGRGLGEGCAIALGDAGAEVVLISRTQEQLDAVAQTITGRGGKAMAMLFDAASPEHQVELA